MGKKAYGHGVSVLYQELANHMHAKNREHLKSRSLFEKLWITTFFDTLEILHEVITDLCSVPLCEASMFTDALTLLFCASCGSIICLGVSF